MTNLQAYDQIFMTNLRVTQEQLPGLKYRSIELWDSLGHMDLVSALEERFQVSLSSLDVLEFSSYEKGKELFQKYGVDGL